MSHYDIAAYIWPAYTGDEPRTRMFWPEGIGEWQTVKNQEPKENGYFWNRKPLRGYENEADSEVMQQQIELAVNHGVNVFIYDWYWYDNRPFLENCLNDGFLKAENNHKMKFYIMWANHDASTLWDRRIAGKNDTVIWQGTVNREQFETVGKRWIDLYFKKENYYKIDNKPVVSIYDLNNLLKGLGGIRETANAFKWLDEECKKIGFEGIHVQFVRYNGSMSLYDEKFRNEVTNEAEIVDKLGFASITNYQFAHLTNMHRDYLDITEDVKGIWQQICDNYNVPYYPHVSIGWDNNPRHLHFLNYITKNNTPENFKKCLQAAKEFCDKNGVNLITVNSWNEWTETSYLLPDNINGYGYLEAIKEVFVYE